MFVREIRVQKNTENPYHKGHPIMDMTVLIVDDEPYIRQLIEQTLEELEDEGVELLTADNGADALDIIQEVQPQLVLTSLIISILSP